MSGKVVGHVVSLILAVTIAIGPVTIVHCDNGNEGETSTKMKAILYICQKADDPKLCKDTLSAVKTDDPKEYITTVVQSTMDKVIKAFNMSDRLKVEHANSDKRVKMILEDCKDLMQYAIHELEASGALVKGNDIQHILNNKHVLKNWLGAVIAYQQSCLDEFSTDGERKVMEQLSVDGLDNVEKLTGLALDVVSGVSEFLASFNLNLNLKPFSHFLLESDHEGFPSWFSAEDRKLLGNLPKEKKGKKGKKEKKGHKGKKLKKEGKEGIEAQEGNEGKGPAIQPNVGKEAQEGNEEKGPAIQPNAVVAKDGSGQFNTIQAALNAYPKNLNGRYVIYVKAGVYNEYITIDKNMPNILIYGDGPTSTIVTGSKNFRDGVPTMRTASFSTVADDFIAKSMAFENTAGPGGHQAVALRVQGDRSAFFDVAIRGYQDSLYAHAKRQFYRNCEISGTVDFIFGYSATVIQNSKLIVRKPDPNQQNIVVADGTAQKEMPTGIILQNCEIIPEAALFDDRFKVRSYLARPWKQFARTIIMESMIGDFIVPEGYMEWAGVDHHQTCYFAEFNNVGPGSNVERRVKWGGYKGLLSGADAARYTPGQWLDANTWLPATGVPFAVGFTK